MLASEMKPDLLYKVTKESSDGTFTTDCIVKLEKEGSLLCIEPICGWLEKEEWQKPKTSNFEVELWTDLEAVECIKESIEEKLDIDDIITEYTQTAMKITKDNEQSSAPLHAQKLWQIAEWLRELKSARSLIHNTINVFNH